MALEVVAATTVKLTARKIGDEGVQADECFREELMTVDVNHLLKYGLPSIGFRSFTVFLYFSNMQIELRQVVPVPLKDKFMQRQSDVWNRNLVFAQGEWAKIKAPSGTGKTTLVHILYKLRHDYEGLVLWQNKDLRTIDESALAQMRQQQVSIIFQDLRLFPSLTARENIELKRVLQKPLYETEVIDAMAEQLGVGHVLNQRAGLCSYGEQQRIAIIRSLVQPFSWLIMDEPFSHLDQVNMRKAADLIAAECKKREAGFILTDLDEDDHFEYARVLNL